MELLSTLKEYFGYDSFRPMQEEIIRHTVNGGDSLVLMPTGGGKSLCFQMAALMMEGTAVVVSPLISLMKDQVENARANGIPAEALNSAGDAAANREVMQRCAEGKVKLLYMSPERLVSDINNFLRYIRISLFAIDEAHCISAWGHDFRAEYTQLGLLKETFPQIPIMALTATADKLTKQDILQQLYIPEARQFVGSFDRPNLSLSVKRGYSERDRIHAVIELIGRHRGESGIVYCLSRKTSEKVASKLQEAGIAAGVYHAGMTTTDRNRVQDDFTNDRIQVVCATIAFGMGIDKSNVRFIVHFNMPKSIENYYQEIGRGGRDGLPCETILFYNLQDIITLRHFAEESGQRDINIDKLQRMQEYAEAQVCRRRTLLNYFGELSDHDCHNCDVCLNPPHTFDGSVAVQKALSGIVRTGQQVGFTVLIDILKGTMSEEVVAHGYQTLKTFGVGMDVPARMWRDFLLQMLQLGYIEIAYNEERHLHVTPMGKEVLRGQRMAVLAVPELERPKSRERHRKEAEPEVVVVDTSLFGQLRTLRRQIAEEAQVPPYVVMSDRSMHEIADTMPVNLDAFSDISGVGRNRCKLYGERFVAAVRSYMEANNIPIDETKGLKPQKVRPPKEPKEPKEPKPRDPHNYMTIAGTRYDIDLDIWELIPWRQVISTITREAYWNYAVERTLDLAEYVPVDLESRNRVISTLCHILTAGYGLPTNTAAGTVVLPLKEDRDNEGNVVRLPKGSFDEIIQRFRQFVVQNQRYPMMSGSYDEVSLRKWYREVGHGLLPVTEEQMAHFKALSDEFASLPKTRMQVLKQQ